MAVKPHALQRWAATGLIGLAIALTPAPTSAATPIDRHIRVEAGNFEYAPAEISVNPGDRVTLELVATDVVHGLHLDGYDLDLSADPGQPARLSFIASQAGTFRFHCSATCGPLHPFMTGKLSVGPNWSLWRAVGLAMLAIFAVVWLRRT